MRFPRLARILVLVLTFTLGCATANAQTSWQSYGNVIHSPAGSIIELLGTAGTVAPYLRFHRPFEEFGQIRFGTDTQHDATFYFRNMNGSSLAHLRAGLGSFEQLRSSGNLDVDGVEIEIQGTAGSAPFLRFHRPSEEYGQIRFGTNTTHDGVFYLRNMNANVLAGLKASHGQFEKLSVSGTVTTKEVVVTASGWADHVFAPEYKLRPLNEVAAYVQAEGHLPEIPSAAEVEAAGVGVSEMQRRLLMKVEELTLYLIDAEKKLETLSKKNAEVMERLRLLERR